MTFSLTSDLYLTVGGCGTAGDGNGSGRNRDDTCLWSIPPDQEEGWVDDSVVYLRREDLKENFDETPWNSKYFISNSL